MFYLIFLSNRNLFLSPFNHSFLKINYLHKYILVLLLFVLLVVGFSLVLSKRKKIPLTGFLDSHFLELLWTILPSLVLIVLSFPSLSLLVKEFKFSLLQQNKNLIKITGLQWFWNTSFSLKRGKFNFDRLLENTPLTTFNLETNLRLPLYCLDSLEWSVTSNDVLHRFALPVLGLKLDATPGRINSAVNSIFNLGVFYGQCSEICGANHSFMPYSVEVIS